MLILPRSPSAKRFRVVEESKTLMALVSQVRNHAPPVQSYSGQAPGPPGRNSAPSNRGGLQAGKRSWRLQPNGKSPTRIVPHQVENAYLYVQWFPDGRHAGAAIQDCAMGKTPSTLHDTATSFLVSVRLQPKFQRAHSAKLWRQRKHMDDGFGRPQPATNWSKHTIRIESSKSNDDYPNGLLVFLNYPLRREG